MKLSNAVYICACVCSKSCHVNRVAVDDAHLSAHIAVNALSDKLFLALIRDKADDVVDFGDNLSHQVSAPLLKCFAENGVVCV